MCRTMCQRPVIVSLRPAPRAMPGAVSRSRSPSGGIPIAGIVNRADTEAPTGRPARVVRTTKVFVRRPPAFGLMRISTR
jgi:hypothetical protein